MSQIDKWVKYSFLNESAQLVPYLPETKLLTKDTFRDFLKKYGTVILKPVQGGGGAGVIQVSSLGKNKFEIHSENQKKKIKGKKKLYQDLKESIESSGYLVQRRIFLAKVDGRPFDLRVIVQRRKKSDVWKVTAKAAKVAGEGYIVTNNTRSRGKMLHAETAMKRASLDTDSHLTLLSNIEKVAVLSAERLSALYPKHRIYGLDVGLDTNGDIWIIETNHYPAMSHFRKLGDKAMYRRIRKYKRG